MKYNDNGEIKNIYIKAADTLPIGTIVDYDGTTVPDGYEKVDDEVVLYENSSGSNVAITLNDNLSKYNKIEIQYYDAGAYNLHGCKTIYNPNNKNFAISETYIVKGGNIYYQVFDNTTYSATGTSINLVGDWYGRYRTVIDGATSGSNKGTNYIYITKVIGYKED